MRNINLNRLNEDNAFMGPTHALSGVAAFLLLVAFAPSVISEITGDNLFVIIATAILFVGASLLPDFDSVRATIISVLGFIGKGISTGMRAIAKVVYSITRSKYDKPDADPHRGFWHTIVAGVLSGFGFFLLVTSFNKVSFEIGSVELSLGLFILWFLITISIQIGFAVFLKKQMRRLSDNMFGSLASWALGGVVSAFIVYNIPVDSNFKWVWVAITGGWICHLLGDTFTTAGTPLIFPLRIKGKSWWTVRFPPYMKADGAIEHYVVIPLFIIIIVGCIVKISIL